MHCTAPSSTAGDRCSLLRASTAHPDHRAYCRLARDLSRDSMPGHKLRQRRASGNSVHPPGPRSGNGLRHSKGKKRQERHENRHCDTPRKEQRVPVRKGTKRNPKTELKKSLRNEKELKTFFVQSPTRMNSTIANPTWNGPTPAYRTYPGTNSGCSWNSTRRA